MRKKPAECRLNVDVNKAIKSHRDLPRVCNYLLTSQAGGVDWGSNALHSYVATARSTVCFSTVCATLISYFRASVRRFNSP